MEKKKEMFCLKKKRKFVCLCWGFTVILPNHTFTGQA